MKEYNIIQVSNYITLVCLDLSCRLKVVKWVQKKFSDPHEAAAYYFPSNPSRHAASVGSAEHQQSLDVKEASTQTEDCLSAISAQFQQHCKLASVKLPEDFLELSKSAMDQLQQHGRTNVVYNFVKAVGTVRTDGTDSRLPISRMPMGMIEHTVNFFANKDINRVSCVLLANLVGVKSV